MGHRHQWVSAMHHAPLKVHIRPHRTPPQREHAHHRGAWRTATNQGDVTSCNLTFCCSPWTSGESDADASRGDVDVLSRAAAKRSPRARAASHCRTLPATAPVPVLVLVLGARCAGVCASWRFGGPAPFSTLKCAVVLNTCGCLEASIWLTFRELYKSCISELRSIKGKHAL